MASGCRSGSIADRFHKLFCWRRARWHDGRDGEADKQADQDAHPYPYGNNGQSYAHAYGNDC